jgi:DNA polymerase-3 subunit alpha (Gram-positive type)
VIELIANGDTFGLPELGTPFVRDVLRQTKPKTFDNLLKISGLTHGTNTWNENADDLIMNGVCELSDVIALRDDVMLYLMKQGIDKKLAFTIMESVRKGKGLTEEQEKTMKDAGVPDWYIDSCRKIMYLFPKAHAAANVMSDVRLAWYKLYYPTAFYSSTLTVNPYGFETSMIEGGKQAVKEKIRNIELKGENATYREKDSLSILYLIEECMSRGIDLLPVSLKKSDSKSFLIENGAIRIPIVAISEIGPYTAQNIVKAREEQSFKSVIDLKIRAKLDDTIIEIFQEMGLLNQADDEIL